MRKILFTLFMAVFTLPAHAEVNVPAYGYTYFVQHYSMGSKSVLMFEVNAPYGKERFGIAPKFIADNVSMLNKFLKWAAMATKRHDNLTKEIGTVVGFDYGAYDYYNKYTFETLPFAGSWVYRLQVTAGTKVLFQFKPQVPDDTAPEGSRPSIRFMSFTADQVREILQHLQEFKDGKIKTRAEIEKDYN